MNPSFEGIDMKPSQTVPVGYRLPMDLLAALKKHVQDSKGIYRSQTHAVESAIRRLIEQDNAKVTP